MRVRRRPGRADAVAQQAGVERPGDPSDRGEEQEASVGIPGDPHRDVDGEANAAVIALLAKTLDVARGAVEVIAGASSRRKTVRVTGVTAARIEELAT